MEDCDDDGRGRGIVVIILTMLRWFFLLCNALFGSEILMNSIKKRKLDQD